MEVLTLGDIQALYIKREQDSDGSDTMAAEHLALFADLADGRSRLLCRLYGPQQEELAEAVVQVLRKRLPELAVKR